MTKPTMMPPVAISSDVQAPSARRGIMSRPLLSQPSRKPEAPPSSANGPLRAQRPKLSSASPHVRMPVLARTAMSTMNTIQPIASHAPRPRPLPRRAALTAGEDRAGADLGALTEEPALDRLLDDLLLRRLDLADERGLRWLLGHDGSSGRPRCTGSR